MAARDADETIGAAVAALRSQTYTDWEAILVDDASVTPVASDVAAKDSRIVIVRNEEPVGRSQSRNRAVAMARGTLLAIFDADDVSHPRRLERQVNMFDRDGGLVVVGGGFVTFQRADRLYAGPRWPVADDAIRHGFIRGRMRLAHPASMMLASAVRAVGGYDERLERAEDFHLITRLLGLGSAAAVEDVVLAYRHPRVESLTAYCRDFEAIRYARLLLSDRRASAGRRLLWRVRAYCRYPAYVVKLRTRRQRIARPDALHWVSGGPL